jgi:acyl-CoA thioesterase FadM
VITAIEDAESMREIATGNSVLVAYDYSRTESVIIPEDWRAAIEEFEGL